MFVTRQEGGYDSSADLISLKGGDPRTEDRQIQPATDWIIVKLPVISVAVIDEHLFTRECITTSLRQFGEDLDIASYATCGDCLESARTHGLVLYYEHETSPGHAHDEERLSCLDRLLKIAPVIVLSAFDHREAIVEAFESGARGYIPTASTTVELAIEIIRLVRAGGTFVPQGSLFPGGTNRRVATLQEITTSRLTPREIKVLDRLKLGKANKIIAHELGVSESTVKINIHNIMRKMKATNRTEVACRAYDISTARGK
jgi:DNA-binding NarL/FixJ family response regulator